MSHGFDFCRALLFSSGAGNVSYTPASLLPGSGVTKSKLLYCYRRSLGAVWGASEVSVKKILRKRKTS